MPLSGPSRFLWALYPSGLKGPGNINDMDHKKRLFGVHGKSKDEEGDTKRGGKGKRGSAEIQLRTLQGSLHVKQNYGREISVSGEKYCSFTLRLAAALILIFEARTFSQDAITVI